MEQYQRERLVKLKAFLKKANDLIGEMDVTTVDEETVAKFLGEVNKPLDDANVAIIEIGQNIDWDTVKGIW